MHLKDRRLRARRLCSASAVVAALAGWGTTYISMVKYIFLVWVGLYFFLGGAFGYAWITVVE